jgi:hypothetical protein
MLTLAELLNEGIEVVDRAHAGSAGGHPVVLLVDDDVDADDEQDIEEVVRGDEHE